MFEVHSFSTPADSFPTTKPLGLDPHKEFPILVVRIVERWAFISVKMHERWRVLLLIVNVFATFFKLDLYYNRLCVLEWWIIRRSFLESSTSGALILALRNSTDVCRSGRANLHNKLSLRHSDGKPVPFLHQEALHWGLRPTDMMPLALLFSPRTCRDIQTVQSVHNVLGHQDHNFARFRDVKCHPQVLMYFTTLHSDGKVIVLFCFYFFHLVICHSDFGDHNSHRGLPSNWAKDSMRITHPHCEPNKPTSPVGRCSRPQPVELFSGQ